MRICRAALALAVLAVLAACADPVDEERDEGVAAQDPLGAEAPDPAREALITDVQELGELLSTSRDRLAAAGEADEPAAARAAADEAVELLIGDPGEGPAALFPVETPERGAGRTRSDQFTSVLTMARELGGDDGRAVTEFLRDLVAGDLGSWQRDADGMVAMVESAARPGPSLEETEAAILELPGEVTRALGWAMLTRDADDLEDARAYAERGTAHLDLVVDGLAELELEAS